MDVLYCCVCGSALELLYPATHPTRESRVMDVLHCLLYSICCCTVLYVATLWATCCYTGTLYCTDGVCRGGVVDMTDAVPPSVLLEREGAAERYCCTIHSSRAALNGGAECLLYSSTAECTQIQSTVDTFDSPLVIIISTCDFLC